MSRMEDNASEMPQIELNPDNWVGQFGGDGQVSTPIGRVKMGDNQIAKLFEKGRSTQFGMIKPTLEAPLAIVEVPSEAIDGNSERGSSLLFIKTFIDKDGKKVYYFKSVTVKKDGLEVSVSSHYDRPKRIKEALEKGKLLYRFDGGAQTEHLPADVSVTTSPENMQGENREEVYNRHTTAKQSVETAETSQDNEQSDIQISSSMDNVSTTSSAGKGIEKSLNANELGEKTLDNGGNALSSHSNQKEESENGTISESIPQGKRREETSQDPRMEETSVGLRDRIEAATRDAQASGGTVSERQSQEIEQRSAESERLVANALTSNIEFDEDGSPFVLSSSNNTIFGEIKADSGLTPAPIKLSLGNSKYGLIHLEKRHGDQIRKAGFKSVDEFVEFVCKNYKRIREGENSLGEANGTYLLQIEDDHNNTLYVELSTDGSYWGVNSGGVFRNGYGNNKKEVWSAPEEQSKQSATDSTLRVEDNTDNQTTPNGNVPDTSADKDTEKSVNTNELGGKVAKAEAETNTTPTEAQKEAGNYKKGHVQVGTFDITIENPKGSERKGTDANGKEWSVKMQNTYGYFRGTEGVDGDHIDVFLADDIDGWNGRKVFVMDQYNEDGTFDEHKVMLGFNDADEAESAYYANYSSDWKEKHPKNRVTAVNIEDFEKWIDSSHRKTKPFAEYKNVKSAETSTVSKKETVATDKDLENEYSRNEVDIKDIEAKVDKLKAEQKGKRGNKREELQDSIAELENRRKELIVRQEAIDEKFHDRYAETKEKEHKAILEATAEMSDAELTNRFSYLGKEIDMLQKDGSDEAMDKAMELSYEYDTLHDEIEERKVKDSQLSVGKSKGTKLTPAEQSAFDAISKMIGDKGIKVNIVDETKAEEMMREHEATQQMSLGDSHVSFTDRQAKAEANKGTVMPHLADKEVEVVSVPRHKYKGTAVEAKNQAITDAEKKYIDPTANKPLVQHYDNYGMQFDYTISKANIDESMNRNSLKNSTNMGAHIAVLNHLPEVIGNSIEVEEHADYTKVDGKRTNDNHTNKSKLIHRFYGAVNIDGVIYRVKTTMVENTNADKGNNHYTYEVTNVEVLNEESSSTSNGDGVPRSASSRESSLAIANLLQGVEKSYDKGKYLLDESKKNTDTQFQIGYHGSPHSFEAFDSSHMGEGEGAQAHGWGTYIAKNREVSEGYAEMARRGYAYQLNRFSDFERISQERIDNLPKEIEADKRRLDSYKEELDDIGTPANFRGRK